MGLCAAGGTFTDPRTGPEAWVRTETHSRWQPALEVPGIAALNVDSNAPGSNVGVDAVSCASAGNCAAGGQYTSATGISVNGSAPLQPFVVAETNGRWGTAREVPGIGAISNNAFADAITSFMACPSAGNCTAAGTYQDAAFDFGCDPQCYAVFVVNERHGTWGQVHPTWFGGASSLTCPAAGDCVAAGTYESGQKPYSTGALISETNDHWTASRLIAGTDSISSVSCASAGYCDAGGLSQANSAFVISEWHGTWGKTVTPAGIPSRGSQNGEPGAEVSAVACPPRIVLCIAGGSETPVNSSRAQAFIVSQARRRRGGPDPQRERRDAGVKSVCRRRGFSPTAPATPRHSLTAQMTAVAASGFRSRPDEGGSDDRARA